MTGKRAENVLEIRAYIRGRSLLGTRHVDVHCEVCDIQGEGQMCHRTVCRWVAKFRSGQQHIKDAAHTGHPATTTSKGNIEKMGNKLRKDPGLTIRQLAQMKNL